MSPHTSFAVLAEPNRLRLVEALRDRAHAVNELAAKTRLHQSGVSRHLKILADAGFVEMRASGAERLYSLRPQAFREIEAWLGRYRPGRIAPSANRRARPSAKPRPRVTRAPILTF